MTPIWRYWRVQRGHTTCSDYTVKESEFKSTQSFWLSAFLLIIYPFINFPLVATNHLPTPVLERGINICAHHVNTLIPIPQTFTECILCARHRDQGWGRNTYRPIFLSDLSKLLLVSIRYWISKATIRHTCITSFISLDLLMVFFTILMISFPWSCQPSVNTPQVWILCCRCARPATVCPLAEKFPH